MTAVAVAVRSNSVCLSVRPSVTREDHVETVQDANVYCLYHKVEWTFRFLTAVIHGVGSTVHPEQGHQNGIPSC